MSSHTEAPASLNFRAYTKKGWQLLVTLRDESEAHLLERFKVTVGTLTEMGMLIRLGRFMKMGF